VRKWRFKPAMKAGGHLGPRADHVPPLLEGRPAEALDGAIRILDASGRAAVACPYSLTPRRLPESSAARQGRLRGGFG
jgi:hypothetical protein